MATVKLDGVRKVYAGGVEAVKGVSIDIADGQLCVLVGPSGCGKSTLLRMIAGLEVITDGEISIDGRVVNKLEPAQRDIAMVFQNYALYPHMKVYDNMAYGLRNRGQSKEEIDQRVREAARILELDELLERKPRELSGGQRQRVAMGRAIVRHPKAFLFDEPLSNLDAKLRVHMRVEIKNLQRSLGVTSVYVTHDQVEAMTLADKLVVMNGGVAEQIDTPIKVYEKPATTFVASFIGSPAMNLLRGSSAGPKGIALAGGQAVKPRDFQVPETGREVFLGVRPEHLTLVNGGNSDLDLKVIAVESLGADTMAHGVLAGSNGTPEKIIVRLPGAASITEGDVLPLAINPGMAHVFDVQTTKRI
ncbi:MAG: sn-glycerol-3-phosphate import ATP-binding protein UgpC [Mesorhizobium sp.]|nr:sn-glycerol-3-phosphate import ATP-binding protein UgpC [Mesorhizobium sp.]